MNRRPDTFISDDSVDLRNRLGFLLRILLLFVAGSGGVIAKPWKPADVVIWADGAQTSAEKPFPLGIGNRIICGNDPVNRHDPLGLAEVSVSVGGVTLSALSRREELYNEAAQFRRHHLGPAADFRSGAPDLSGLDSALKEMQALGRQRGFGEISDEDICATMALGQEYQNSYNAAIKPYQDAQHAYVSSNRYVVDATLALAPAMMLEAATITAEFVAMEALTAGMGTPLAGARMVNRARRLEEVGANRGIAASFDGSFQLGSATKVNDINALLRAEGVLPEGYSVRFTSRNNMLVRDAAGYGPGTDVQALGSLRSVGWQSTRSGGAQLNVERLADGTIPITLDGRLTRNLDLLRGVIRHEVEEGNFLLPYAGQIMSRQRAFNLGNAAHAAGMRAQGF